MAMFVPVKLIHSLPSYTNSHSVNQETAPVNETWSFLPSTVFVST